MSLYFSADTDLVNLGSSASLDNLSAATVAAWVNMDTISDATEPRLYNKAGTQRFALVFNATQFGFEYSRSTTICRAKAAFANLPALDIAKWCFLACVMNSAGVNSDQQVFVGSLTSAVTEASAYDLQGVGSGTHDDAGADALIGHNTAAGSSIDGFVAWMGIWNRALTLGELQAQQFHPHVTAGCVGFYHLGWTGTGTQPDWSGNENVGTVTGATVGNHVPLGPAFGFDENWYAAAVAAQQRRFLLH